MTNHRIKTHTIPVTGKAKEAWKAFCEAVAPGAVYINGAPPQTPAHAYLIRECDGFLSSQLRRFPDHSTASFAICHGMLVVEVREPTN